MAVVNVAVVPPLVALATAETIAAVVTIPNEAASLANIITFFAQLPASGTATGATVKVYQIPPNVYEASQALGVTGLYPGVAASTVIGGVAVNANPHITPTAGLVQTYAAAAPAVINVTVVDTAPLTQGVTPGLYDSPNDTYVVTVTSATAAQTPTYVSATLESSAQSA